MLRWILEWFHAFIISMHDWAAAPCGLVVQLWLALIIELCADSKYVATGFKNWKGLFGAQIWFSLSREQLRSWTGLNAGQWRRWVQKLWNKGGKFREEGVEKSWLRVFSAKGSPCFRCWHSTLLTRQHLWAAMAGYRADLLPLILSKPPQIKWMSNL